MKTLRLLMSGFRRPRACSIVYIPTHSSKETISVYQAPEDLAIAGITNDI